MKQRFTKLVWLQIEFKVYRNQKLYLGTKSNVQKESKALEGIKGNERVKQKYV